MKREVLQSRSEEFCGTKRGVLRRESKEFCGDKARSFAETKEGVLWR